MKRLIVAAICALAWGACTAGAQRLERAVRMVEVSSSLIAMAGYDEEQKMLAIQFVGGEVYLYDGVPRDVYEALLNAESKGRYFHTAIKGVFPFRRQVMDSP